MALKKVYARPRSLTNVQSHYCAGCGHGTAHTLVAEALDHFGLRERAVGVASAGCSCLLYKYFDVDTIESAHGRAMAVATGLKRANPDLFVFTYQGDGDLASIGLCETVHASNRGEKLSVIFINNAVYGMTGGQMAPTTLIGQQTTTSPAGRRVEHEGTPIHMAEMLGKLDGVAHSERVAVYDPKHVMQARKAIFKAFEAQLNGHGLGFVEVLSACVTNLKTTPVKANQWVEDEMMKTFPLGLFKSVEGQPAAATAPAAQGAV